MRNERCVCAQQQHNFAVLTPRSQTTVALDLYLEYLRAAFNTCYYCSVTTDHVEELQRKCIKHVRKPLPAPSKPATPADEQAKQIGSDVAMKSESQSSEKEEGKGKEEEGGEKTVGEQKDREKREVKIVSKERHGGGSFTPKQVFSAESRL